jgi:hypothetical protein
MVLAGQFLVEKECLSDYVLASSTGKNSGMALKIEAASTWALMAGEFWTRWCYEVLTRTFKEAFAVLGFRSDVSSTDLRIVGC